MIKDVTDLVVYQESIRLLKSLYELLERIPNREYNLKEQTKRAGEGIPASIAEGFAKRYYQKEFKRYLLIALGSSDEIISHLRCLMLTCRDLENDLTKMIDEYKTLSRRINSLHKKWNLLNFDSH